MERFSVTAIGFCLCDGRHRVVTLVTKQRGALRSSQGCDGRNTDRVLNEGSVTEPLESDEFIIFLGNWILEEFIFFLVYLKCLF